MSSCPVCEWDGRIAEKHDRSHKHYTHITIEDGTVVSGQTCSIEVRSTPSILAKIPLLRRYINNS